MRVLLVLALLLVAACQSSGPYSLQAQLGRRLGNIAGHLEPESLGRTLSRHMSNLQSTTERMVQVPTRLRNLESGVRGVLGAEGNRVSQLGAGVENFVEIGFGRLDRTLRRFGNPSPAWREHLSLARILARFEGALLSLGTTLGLDRRILPMPGDPERQTDPNQPPGPTPTLWDRIFYRLRL